MAAVRTFSRPDSSPLHVAWMLVALVAAWVCANRPQPLAYALTGWVQNAAHFSHHERLVKDIRALFATAAVQSPEEDPALSARPEAERASPASALAENPVQRRPEWSRFESLVVPAPRETAGRFARAAAGAPSSFVADVPSPPPRSGDVS